MKLKVKVLKRIIESVLLAEEEVEQDKEKLGSASLDDQIDKFLINFEKTLKEAKEDETPQVQQTAKPTLDVNHFAKGVARIFEHYDDLIDIPGTIFRRAMNFVKSNYDEETAKKLEQALADDFQIGPDVRDLDSIQAPAGGAATPVDISATAGGA
jgi:hypothetical protein